MKPTVTPPLLPPAEETLHLCSPALKTTTRLPAPAPRRQIGFPSSVVEFLLLFRLRARRRSPLCADMLERAVRVVLVTCKNWFTRDGGPSKDRPVSRH